MKGYIGQPDAVYSPELRHHFLALQTATKHLIKSGLQLLRARLQKILPLRGLQSFVTPVALVVISIISTPVLAIELADLENLAVKGQHKQIVRSADEVINKNPNNPRPLFLKAHSLAQLNRNTDAIAAYTQLTQKFPGLPEPFNNLATLYMSEGQLDQARIALEQALATNDAYNTAFRNLSAVYQEMASRAYRQAMNNTVQIDAVRLTTMSDVKTWQPEPVLLASNNDDLIAKPLISQSVVTATPEPAPDVEAANVEPAMKDVVSTPSSSTSSIEIASVTDINEEQLVTEPDSIQIAARSTDTTSETNKSSDDTAAEIRVAAIGADKQNEPVIDKATVQKDLINVVQSWAKAWASKDVDSYLAYYASEFKPEKSGLTRSAWAEQRKGRLRWRKYIKIDVQKPTVKLNGDMAEVTFSQSYESDVYEDEVTKTLSMKRVKDDWKITRERSEA